MNIKKGVFKFLSSFGVATITLTIVSFKILAKQEVIVFLNYFLILSLVAGVLGVLIPSDNLKKNYSYIIIPSIVVVIVIFLFFASY